MREDFIEYLDDVQNMIFSHDFQNASKTFVDKMYLWEKVISTMTEENIMGFNNIMLEVFTAQQKEDFLLMADLFEYRVKPFITSLK